MLTSVLQTKEGKKILEDIEALKKAEDAIDNLTVSILEETGNAERIERLYKDGRLSGQGVRNAVTKNWITQEQANRILGTA